MNKDKIKKIIDEEITKYLLEQEEEDLNLNDAKKITEVLFSEALKFKSALKEINYFLAVERGDEEAARDLEEAYANFLKEIKQAKSSL